MDKIKMPKDVSETLFAALGTLDSEYSWKDGVTEKVCKAEEWLEDNTEEE